MNLFDLKIVFLYIAVDQFLKLTFLKSTFFLGGLLKHALILVFPVEGSFSKVPRCTSSPSAKIFITSLHK